MSQPPIVVPLREAAERLAGIPTDQIEQILHEQFRGAPRTLRDDLRRLLERFEFVDAAREVVGVGSVGTGAYIALLRAGTTGTRCSFR